MGVICADWWPHCYPFWPHMDLSTQTAQNDLPLSYSLMLRISSFRLCSLFCLPTILLISEYCLSSPSFGIFTLCFRIQLLHSFIFDFLHSLHFLVALHYPFPVSHFHRIKFNKCIFLMFWDFVLKARYR